jgi:hypothetical protein
MDVFKNTLCCFTVKLPQAIRFDDEALWEVALVEIIHPTQIKNIVENQNTLTIEVYDEQVQQPMDDRRSVADFIKSQDPKTK